MKPKTFSPTDLEPILKIASDCGLILVGGQAVGCWATLLETPDEEPWKSRRPYTSRDADALCTRNQMLQFAKSLTESGWAGEVYEPDKNEERINTGAIRIHGMIGNKRQTVEMNGPDARRFIKRQRVNPLTPALFMRGWRLQSTDFTLGNVAADR